MSFQHEANSPSEKHVNELETHNGHGVQTVDPVVAATQHQLHRKLKGRHMQMIAM